MKKKRIYIINIARSSIGIILAGLLIYFTTKKADLNILEEIQDINFYWLFIAFFAYGIVLIITMFRWHSLLKVQGVNLSAKETCRLTMIGVFFNLAIPGAVSGDFIKMAYITKHTQKNKAGAILTIMLDRIIGLVGLFSIALIAIICSLDFIRSQTSDIKITAAIIAAGSLMGIIFFLAVEYKNTFLKLRWIKIFLNFTSRFLPEKINMVIIKFSKSIDLYKNQKKVLVKALLLSMAVHTTLSFSLYSAGKALKEADLSIKDYALTTQVSNAISAIPVMPAGIGLRDAVTQHLLEAAIKYRTNKTLQNKQKTAAIPLIITFSILIWGLLGGI
ncbi:MAG: lysylphosphatidylglycerol synthase transmembrane domain-containing protein, partial [Verrucomicrobiota bacterium]|nr:lysylphosphatidylglycerol synthase transmembrane domain-containing protein [Verrucomicrobiota bacterium]